VDANGNLVTSTGQFVEGWTQTGGVLNTSGAITDITIPSGALQPPVTTANMTINMNLNAAATVGAANGTFTTPVTVYDSLGNSHVLTFDFTITGPNTWTYAVSVPGADVTAGKAGTPFPIPNATGTLTFDSNGNLTAPALAKNPVNIKITGLSDGASDMSVNWSLYNPDGTPRITQFATPTAVASESQDGQAAAQLTHVSLSNGGEILAQFSNGSQLAVAQLALASIRNPDSLTSVGNNNFQLSAKTAAPAVGTPNTGGRGNVLSGALESSTVDVAHEFTNLITFQRSYEASAKVITTTDTLTQDTINLIR
jgi:flagellar hook protein FlgE